MSADICEQNNQRVECLLYVVFLGSSTGLSTGPLHVIQRPRAMAAKWSSEGQSLNKFEARNWSVPGKTEAELITSGLVNTAQEGVKLFKVCRVLQMSGYSSP